MGWLKIDDKFPRNPKVLAADAEAMWYYVCALSHCAEQLTDGFVADSVVPLVAPHVAAPQDVAERLVAVDLICRVDGGYVVPDYLEFNPSRESVLEKREKERDRQARHRDSSREVSRRDSRVTSDVSHSVPSRPVPSPVDTSSRQSSSTSPGAVDNSTTADEVAAAVVELRYQRQSGVKNATRWKASCLRNLRTDEDGSWWAELERLCAEFPTAPVSMLAAAAEGEKSPHLRNFRKVAS